jgi:septal ring factor EnvC (AmiA/AmiB activator)
MEEAIVKEIRRLKAELDKKKKEIEDIKDLVNKEIDRPFPPRVEDFSERELETYLAEYITLIKKHIDSRPEKELITSHRKILGKPIIFLKRILLKAMIGYNDIFLAKQIQFNRESVDLYQALLLQARNNKKRMKQVQEKITSFEENLAVLGAKLEDLRAGFEQTKNRTANHKNEPERS